MTKAKRDTINELRDTLQRANELLILLEEEEGYTMEQAIKAAKSDVVTGAEKDLESLESIVTGYIKKLGIPAHIKGFQYIRVALIMAIEDVGILDSITKGLYPSIAAKYGTTPSRVERAIRHAIEVAWTRADKDFADEMFGYTISWEKGKPTNSEFIAVLADNIRLQMDRARMQKR